MNETTLYGSNPRISAISVLGACPHCPIYRDVLRRFGNPVTSLLRHDQPLQLEWVTKPKQTHENTKN